MTFSRRAAAEMERRDCTAYARHVARLCIAGAL
jgi:hypothetical protein